MKKYLRVVATGSRRHVRTQHRWLRSLIDQPNVENETEEWLQLINDEMKTIDELEDVICESRAVEDTSVKIPSAVLQKKKVKVTPLEEIKNILMEQQRQLDMIQVQINDRRDEQHQMFEKSFTQLEASIQDMSGANLKQAELKNNRTKHVDEIYTQELKELKGAFDQNKARLEASMNRIKYSWEGSPEAWKEFYQSQLGALVKDHKRDVERLQRTHDRAADDVISSSEKSNKIILEILSRQVRQNVGSGVTIGFLLIVVALSLIANYVQLVFIKLNGVPFVFSTVLRYICSRNTRESLPTTDSRHMDIMVGMS